MADLWVTLAAVAVLATAVIAILRRYKPDPEIVGVSVGPGEWGALSFRLPKRRAYRVWAHVSIDGHRADVAAELEVKTPTAVLHPPAPIKTRSARWYHSASSFALELCTLPELDAGTVVVVRGRFVGTDGTPLQSARIYVGG